VRQNDWPYFGRGTKRLRNTFLPIGWIDSGAPMAWFSHVSDLSPQDFFLWRYVMKLFYQGNNNDLQVLKACIRDYVVTKTHNLFQKR
jgi:hypothetical protein